MFWGSGNEHKVNESHDGQTIKVGAGDTILITLPHSSVDKWGFEWPCDPNQGQTLYYYGEADSQSGEQTLEFVAQAAGSEQIKLERKQTPGNGNAVIKTFTVNIEVTGDLSDQDEDW